jgi:hypothetical protein
MKIQYDQYENSIVGALKLIKHRFPRLVADELVSRSCFSTVTPFLVGWIAFEQLYGKTAQSQKAIEKLKKFYNIQSVVSEKHNFNY